MPSATVVTLSSFCICSSNLFLSWRKLIYCSTISPKTIINQSYLHYEEENVCLTSYYIGLKDNLSNLSVLNTKQIWYQLCSRFRYSLKTKQLCFSKYVFFNNYSTIQCIMKRKHKQWFHRYQYQQKEEPPFISYNCISLQRQHKFEKKKIKNLKIFACTQKDHILSQKWMTA